MKLIGLSLSSCVRQIAEGTVPIEAVHHICTGCSPSCETDVEGIVNDYLNGPWKRLHYECMQVFITLRDSHRIAWVAHWEKNPVCGCYSWVPYPEVHEDFASVDHLVKEAVIKHSVKVEDTP